MNPPRLGIGFYLPGPAERQILALQAALPPSLCARTRPHLTLATTPPGGRARPASDVLPRFRAWAASLGPLALEMGSIEAASDPRLGTTAVFRVEPARDLVGLRAAAAEVLSPGGDRDERPWFPHVTLYRSDGPDPEAERRVRALDPGRTDPGRTDPDWTRTIAVERVSLVERREERWSPLLHLPLGLP